MRRTLRLEGLPVGSSKIKVKLFLEKVCKRCNIQLYEILASTSSTEITFSTEEELQKFSTSIPGYEFGGNTYYLRTYISDDNDEHHSEDNVNVEENPRSQNISCIEKPTWDLSRTYTWFDMEELWDQENQKAILVQIKDANIGPNDIIKYFEDANDSNDAHVNKMLLMVDGILITFYSENAVTRILEKKKHKINGIELLVFKKIIPEYHKDQLILHNVSGENLSKEARIMEVSNFSPIGTSPENITDTDIGDIYCINYEVELDTDDFKGILENSKCNDFYDSSKILPLAKSDCIIAKGLPKDFNTRELKIIFENKRYTDSAEITRIDKLKNGDVLLYFTSFKDAEKIFKKYKDEGVQALNLQFNIELYYHCFSSFHKNLVEEHFFDVVSQTMQEHETEPMRFEYTNFEEDVFQFLIKRKNHMHDLHNELEKFATVGIRNKMFEIKPISLEHIDNHNTFKATCIKILDQFFKKYTVSTYHEIKVSNLKKVRENFPSGSVTSSNLRKDGCDDLEKDYNVKWTGTDSHILVVTGLKDVVASTVKDIVASTNIEEEFQQLDEGKYRWVVDTGELERIQKEATGKCVIKQHDDEHKLSYEGTPAHTLNAKYQMLHCIESIKDQEFECLDQDQKRFLTNSNNEKYVIAYINKALVSIKGTITIDGQVLKIWCNGNKINTAVVRIRGLLTTDKSVTLSNANKEALKLKEWKDKKEFLESNHMLEISIQNTSLRIVGFCEFMKNAVSLVHEFLEEYSEDVLFYETTYGKAEYLFKYSTDFKKCLENKKIKAGVEFDSKCGIRLEGKKKLIAKVHKDLKTWDEKISEKTEKFEKFKIQEYLYSPDGKAAIGKVCTDHKCVILIEGEIPKLTKMEKIVTERNEIPSLPQEPRTIKQEHDSPFTLRSNGNAEVSNIKLSVHEGDITLSKHVGIVNSIGNSFSLKQGGQLCKVILKKGGNQIQSQLDSETDKTMRITSGGSLPCKYVVHAVFEKNCRTNEKQLKRIFDEAEKRQWKSIAIPAIGTGDMSMSSKDSASTILEVFKNFKASSPRHLKVIDVVIFNKSLISTFEETFSTKSESSSSIKAHNSSDATGIQTTASNAVTIGPILVSVKEGDITDDKNDIIVSSVGSNFDLSKGNVSKTILQKGGKQIQEELSNAAGRELRVTSGGKLQCRKIFHVVFPNTEQQMIECIQNILNEAEKCQSASISLPALGTGNLNLQSAAVAALMRKSLNQFVSKNSATKYLKKVDVVIYDKPKIQDFIKELITAQKGAVPKLQTASPKFVRLTTQRSSTPRSSIEEALLRMKGIWGGIHNNPPHRRTPKFGNLEVAVRQGDITQEKVDAIVNSTGSCFNLSHGMVSKAILLNGGNKIQKELSSQKKDDTIRMTSGGKLQCKKIFHVAFPDDQKKLQECLFKTLNMVDDNGCISLSIPAIGTGNKKMSNDVMAKIIHDAITDFILNRPVTKSLNIINVVIYEQHRVKAFEEGILGANIREDVKKMPDFQSKQVMQDSLHEEKVEIPIYDKSNLICLHSITLHFYSAKKMEMAIESMKRHIDAAFDTKIISIPNKQLRKWIEDDLKSMKSSGKVDVDIRLDDKISLKGLKVDVATVSQQILKLQDDFKVADIVAEHAMYTWKYYNVQEKKWIDFDAQSSVVIEKAKKKSNNTKIKILINGVRQDCSIDFKAMKISGKSFVYKVERDIKEEIPSHWEKMSEIENLKDVQLNSSCAEFREIEENLGKTLSNFNINSIHRIQNKRLYNRYQQEKRRVAKLYPGKNIEMKLFHGTKADIANKITTDGFDRGYCGSANDVAFGNGVYFAKNASYSNNTKYATPEKNNERTIIVANVITGEYQKGTRGMKSAERISSSAEMYNCVVNDTTNPTIFVIFVDAGAYPSYLIKYTV
uniref:protein mono-ADP-ribosyltransferase PARP14-like isoform X2 n=1 Tax=Styela clava TaxID=7725 RepID=UPI0019396A8F|nr:protein mono-ADP-ribosyltransferase PARP14-like isoform X2 [Styela clava]